MSLGRPFGKICEDVIKGNEFMSHCETATFAAIIFVDEERILG